MTNLAFTLNAGIKFDTETLQQELSKISDSVKKAPAMKLKTGFEAYSNQEAARNVLNTISAQASVIDSIIAKQVTYKNLAGETVTALTQMTIKWRDENGNVYTRVEQLDSKLEHLGGEYKKISEETSQLFVGKQVSEITKQFEQRTKEFDNMAKRGQDYATRSEKWSAKEREDMQKTNDLLQKQIAGYRALLEAKNFERLPEAEKAIRATNAEMEKLISQSKYGAGALRGWSESITNAIKQTISYTFSLGALRAAQMALNQGIQYAIDLNTEMTKIQVLQVEGAKTSGEIEELALAYNGLAKEMSVTTLEIARGSVEWLRQGKTIKETQELLKASTMLSKLGNMEASEATEYLTSTLNSYGIEAEKAIEVVDKLVAVDNVAATSAKELATALRYSAASAKDAGVSIEQLISYTGIVSSTTRQNAESIGQAFKTIFARMQDIKAGRIDEDGLGINNVDTALKRVNIQLRNTDGSFRDLGTVLEELSTRWDSLNDIEQENIAKSIAGVRQQNLFRILMTNMNDALELQEEQYKSTGLAADRYSIYLESVQAAQGRLKATTEGLWQDAIRSGLIKSVIDGATSILEFIDAIGGLQAIFVALGITILAIKWSALASAISNIIVLMGAATTVTEGLTAVLASLNLTMLASPWFVAIAAVAALAGGLYYLSQQAERNQKAFDKLSESSKKLSDEYSSLRKSKDDVISLWKEFETLRDKENKTAEETQRLIDLQNQLNELAPGAIAGEYDDQLNFRISENAEIETTIKLLEQELELKKQLALEEAKKAAEAGEKVASDRQKRREELEKIIAEGGADPSKRRAGRSGAGGGMSNEEYQAYMRERVEIARRELLQIEHDEVVHARTVLDVYKKLGSEIERQAYKRTITSKEALEAIEEYEREKFSESYYGEKTEKVEQEIYIKPVIDDNQFAIEIEKVRKRISDMEELVKRANLGEFISAEDMILIREAGLAFETTANGISIAQSEFEKFVESEYAAVEGSYALVDSQQAVVDTMQQGYGVFNQTQTAFQQTYQGLASALWNYSSETGFAFSTMTGQAITSADGIFAALAASSASFQNIVSQMAIQTGQTTLQVMQQIAAYASQMTSSMIGLAPTPQISFPTPSSAGGGGGKSAEEEAAEREIKRLEKRKDALDDAYKAFKRYIDAQKESLRLQKEEAEFQDELAEKEKNLADLKAEIALLALDDSEEARAKRLQLEEQLAEEEEEITELKEDRKYELQVDALDKALEDYKLNMEKKMELLDDEIEKLREVAEAAGSGSGGVGGAYQETGNVVTSVSQQVQTVIEAVISKLKDEGKELEGIAKEKLPDMIQKWIEAGLSIDEATRKAYNYVNALILAAELGGYAGQTAKIERQEEAEMHTGGLVESHHDGNFIGGLKSNEVFAKLLKGEFVATEAQMDTFLRRTLPSMVGSPQISTRDGGNNVSVSMPITVQGNLDKKVIPDMEKIAKTVVDQINESLYNRGIIRNTNITRI